MWPKLTNIEPNIASKIKSYGDSMEASKLNAWIRVFSGAIVGNQEVGYGRRHSNNYEVSSAGDKRFSAMYAQLPSGQTIENAYQTLKGTGKGRPALDPNFDYWGTYKGLWNEFFDANPNALTEIAEKSSGKVLTDRFANTSNNQARAIHEILVERGLRSNMLPKQALRGTPEQGANIALQMDLERRIRSGEIVVPSGQEPLPFVQRSKSVQGGKEIERAKQQREREAREASPEVNPRQIQYTGSGRYAPMLTGPEITRRSVSGYEQPHYPMSEPYNPHIGTRVTQLPPDVLGQTLGPGVTPPVRPSALEQYRAQPVPTRYQATQLSIPGTQEAATTPLQQDPHTAQLAAYMARRAQQLPGRFAYVEPAKQLNLKLF